jgi:predicted amidohydrolase YtcJ
MTESTLFIKGKIWQEDRTFKESFGINKNKFDFVGYNKGSVNVKSNYANIVNLGGKTVLPGLIDSHVHLVYGSIMKKSIDCRDINTLNELGKTIKNNIAKNKNDHEWVIGGNLNLNKLNIEFKNGNPLDKISSKSPLLFFNYDYHSALINSQAIKESGLFEKLSLFAKEEIVTFEDGSPTGIIKEEAMKYVFDNLPQPSLDSKTKAVAEFINKLHSFGITGVCDISLPEDIEVYRKLSANNRLKIMINSYLPITENKNIERFIKLTNDIDKDFFNIKGFKVFYDGSLGSLTALFKENYLGQANNGTRTKIVESGILPKLFKKLDKEGWQLITHAIGDKAVSGTLELIEGLIKNNGQRDRRFRIEHAQHIDEDDFPRFSKSEVIVSAQPVHLKYDIELVKKNLPKNIIKRTHNYKNLIDLGIKVCLGTDFPIVEINPFENIQMALTRKIGIGSFFPENRIDLHNCIKGYTINGAYASFSEKFTGSIEKGKRADFVILNRDIFSVPEEEIGNINALETYVNGEKVYSNPC